MRCRKQRTVRQPPASILSIGSYLEPPPNVTTMRGMAAPLHHPSAQRLREAAFGDFVSLRDRKLLGALIRDLRVAAGYTQRDFAARLGVPKSVVSKIEIGDR